MLERLAKEGPVFSTVFDIGASDGRWARDCMDLFPSAHFHLLQAQAYHFDALDALAASQAAVSVSKAVAAAQVGDVWFDVTDPFDGAIVENLACPKCVKLPATTLDVERDRLGLSGPFAIKLDTHGCEVAILEGGRSVLRESVAIVMECHNFKICDSYLVFPDMPRHMDDLGFRCVDMADLVWRPTDGALWQMDVLFVRNDRAEFTTNVYNETR
jgi:FkbM family methyltransferase